MPRLAAAITRDRASLAGGVDVMARDGRQIAALMRVLHDLAEASIARRSVAPLMEFVIANMTASMDRFADARVACGRGCFFCCHIWVDATPAELLHLGHSLAGERRARVLEALAKALEKTGGLSIEAREHLVEPCPMLVDKACSVYGERPLACRALAALDAVRCERAFVHLSGELIDIPQPYMLAGYGYRLALDGALRKAGLDYRPVELNSGLALALTRADAEAEWLARGDPFAEAERPPPGDPFDDPNARALYDLAFG
ncbi:MAG: YkgJ family cysteine cluster protein [Allosphingosinicella sp.]